jgi:membrane protein
VQKELRRVVDGVTDRARRGDVLVMAAALTTYAAFGLVPLLAISARLTSALLGPDRVVRTARGLAGFVPGPLHLDTSIVSFAQHAATAPWWTVLVALLPASLYAEGIVRCLERFSTTPERRSRTVRGRLLTLVLLALAMTATLVVVGPVQPLLFDPFGSGLRPRLLGILVGFNVLFFLMLAVLAAVYRWFASTRIAPSRCCSRPALPPHGWPAKPSDTCWRSGW